MLAQAFALKKVETRPACSFADRFSSTCVALLPAS
jgi:hypothetical protein